jgi:hypothetical protein
MSDSPQMPDSRGSFPQPKLPPRKDCPPTFIASDTGKVQVKKKTVRISLPPQRDVTPGVLLRRRTTRARHTWWKFWKR